LRLYDFLESGNGYKVRLLLHQLGIPFERLELDITRGESRTEAYLGKNRAGQIPLLELPDGRTLAQSNAILGYLAEGSELLPEDRFERALVQQWMFFEQYSHEPYIAVVRFWAHTGELERRPPAEVEDRRARGRSALAVMEDHLSREPFFVGGSYTIADIALYAYTHVAPEGGFDLAAFPAVERWLARVAEQPGHVPITWAGD